MVYPTVDLFIYFFNPAWDSLCLLILRIHVFHQCWKIITHYLSRSSLSPTLHSMLREVLHTSRDKRPPNRGRVHLCSSCHHSPLPVNHFLRRLVKCPKPWMVLPLSPTCKIPDRQRGDGVIHSTRCEHGLQDQWTQF